MELFSCSKTNGVIPVTFSSSLLNWLFQLDYSDSKLAKTDFRSENFSVSNSKTDYQAKSFMKGMFANGILKEISITKFIMKL